MTAYRRSCRRARHVIVFGTTDSALPLAYGAGSVWVKKIDGDRETLFQIDPATNLIVHAVDVAARGASGLTGAVTVGADYIWTGNWDDTVTQIDPSTTRIMRRYALPSPPQNLEYGDGALWIDSYDANTHGRSACPDASAYRRCRRVGDAVRSRPRARLTSNRRLGPSVNPRDWRRSSRV